MRWQVLQRKRGEVRSCRRFAYEPIESGGSAASLEALQRLERRLRSVGQQALVWSPAALEVADESVERYVTLARPVLVERLELDARETRKRVIETGLCDRPIDELGVAIEAEEAEQVFEPALWREERIGGVRWKLRHRLLWALLCDLAEPTALRGDLSRGEGVLGGARSLDDLEVGRAREERLQAGGTELDPEALIAGSPARELLDSRDRSRTPFRALTVSDLHSLRVHRWGEHGGDLRCSILLHDSEPDGDLGVRAGGSGRALEAWTVDSKERCWERG